METKYFSRRFSITGWNGFTQSMHISILMYLMLLFNGFHTYSSSQIHVLITFSCNHFRLFSSEWLIVKWHTSSKDTHFSTTFYEEPLISQVNVARWWTGLLPERNIFTSDWHESTCTGSFSSAFKDNAQACNELINCPQQGDECNSID
jgi:hypothetical protein